MDKFNKLKKQVNKISNNTNQAIQKATKEAGSKLNDVVKNASDTFDDVKDSTGKALNKAAKNASETFDDVRDGTGKALNKAGKEIQKLGNNIVQGVQDGVDEVNHQIDNYQQDRQIVKNNPVFFEEYNEGKIQLTSMIQVLDEDQRTNLKACKDAIAFVNKPKDGIQFLTILKNKFNLEEITLLPNSNSGIYYEHPLLSNTYIQMDEYFAFLKTGRVSELQKIAQDLGASHFKVTFKEKKKTYTDNNAKVDAKIKKKGIGNIGGSASKQTTSNEEESIDIAAEIRFTGCSEPTAPELLYFKDDQDIKGLIEMRLNSTNPIQSKRITFEYSKLAGINEKEAAKIDATLSAINCAGNTTISSAVSTQKLITMEYLIEF